MTVERKNLHTRAVPRAHMRGHAFGPSTDRNNRRPNTDETGDWPVPRYHAGTDLVVDVLQRPWPSVTKRTS